MDEKGITWVGNVYQKFENMCLEVEEVMYQDTVKYVEDQVQSVGASVRRLMQDFLPPSSLDSETVAPFCFTVEQHSDNGVCEKPNVTDKNELSKADNEQLTRTFKVTSEISEDLSAAPLIHVRHDADDSCRPSDDYNVRGACSGLRSRKRHSVSKSNVSNSGASIATSCSGSPPEKCLIEASSVSGDSANEIHNASSVQTAKMTTTSVDGDTRPDTVLESIEHNENARKFMTDLSDEVVLIESIGDYENETEITSSGGVSVGPSASDSYLAYKVVYNGGLSRNAEVQYDEYGDEENFMSYPNQPRKMFNWNLTNDIKTGFEDGAETIIQQHNKSALEETVVLVNEDDLQFLPQRECNNTPSKKKSLYSRMWSGRKHEYKQLALQHVDGENLNHKNDQASTPKRTAEDTEKLPSRDSCESEWELL